MRLSSYQQGRQFIHRSVLTAVYVARVCPESLNGDRAVGVSTRETEGGALWHSPTASVTDPRQLQDDVREA